jgi:hypothetical protein
MTPADLTAVLLKMPPRSAQVLGHRFVQGLSREACAELYGVTPEAWDVLLLRAARDFEGQTGPQSFEIEQQQAAGLRTQLEDSHALKALTTHREEIQRLLDEAEARAEASPERKRETLLRWIAIVTIAALSLYFYQQQQEREQNQRRAPHPTVPAPDTTH